MGFVQVWLDVETINISNIAAVVRAGQTSLSISSYYLSLIKAKQRLRANQMLLSHLLQSPVRNIRFGNFNKKEVRNHYTYLPIKFDWFRLLH